MNATDKKSKSKKTKATAENDVVVPGPHSTDDITCNDDESRVSEAPAERLWSDGLVLLLHLILPIAITGAIIGRKAIFSKLSTHLDKSFIAVFCPSFSKREKLKKWMIDYLPNVDGNLVAMWKDGSLMCTLINSVVPGACPNPHRHWKKPPIHGQALAYKYLGVIPVFSEIDFQSLKPTTHQEKLLIDYVCNLQAAIDKMAPNSDLTFSTRYIARGMGLVTGEQHRKTVIYVYPNFKGQTFDDLLVNIRGPYNTYGSSTLKALSFTRDKHTKLPDKRLSFLKTLSADFSNLLKPKEKGPACDIEIKSEFEKDRAKLVFVPNNSGVYEICLTTNGEHIAGSPFNLSVEKNRSGITQNLNDEDVRPAKPEKKNAKIKKKVLNTVIYYEKLRNDDVKLEEEVCNIALSTDENSNTAKKVQEEYTLPILETLDKLNDLLESTEKLNVVEETSNNFGLNIIETMRNIPELKKSEEQPVTIKETTETIPKIESTNHDFHYDELLPEKSEIIYQKQTCLEDSGTYVNDDIDPDSLSSSVEMQGSSEEISFSGGSGTGSDLNENENEVNNNDIMVKSNEDICYLILNQNTTDRHKRIYSKDFISCEDEQSKDDLSKSDPNLHREQTVSVSALSQDNVQEAHDATMSSRMFKKHPQEGQRIAGTRSHSYSHGSLLDTSSSCNSKDGGHEFKQHFLRRKAFWTNMSRSNMSLAESSEIRRSSSHKSCGRLDETDARKLSGQHPIVRNLARSESAKNLELRSRSLDYVRQRKKADTPAREGRFGSVDDLNFPSVRHRREVYLNEQRNQTPSKSLDRQELYAVRGEKYSWSIHDKIKSFETGSTSLTPVQQEKLQTLPENITITTKIKERFEKAQNYFKHLEGKTNDKRRHSLDGERFASLRPFLSEKAQTNRRTVSYGNTVAGCTSLDSGRDPVCADNNELQIFLNERRKKRQARKPIVDVFN